MDQIRAFRMAPCREKPTVSPTTPVRLTTSSDTCAVQAASDRKASAPAILLGQAPSDRGRQRPPRPGCLVRSHTVSPVSLPGRAKPPVPTTCLITAPGTQKALSSLGKGLDLQKLVAGAGFEPATSGL